MAEEQVNPVEPPRGIYTSRVDDKGRLKLPKDFEDYLRGLPEQNFFVTSLDGRTIRVYPMPLWRQNEKFLEEEQTEPEAAEDVSFLANMWGAVSALDGQGRVLIPPELRRRANVENQPVWVVISKGAVEVYNEASYNERLGRATVNLNDKIAALRKKGFK